MTLIRRSVVRISEFVVRWASDGSREWAEGLAREVAFIQSDWRALGWAIGSLQVLVDPREAPVKSLDEVPNAAQKLVELARSGIGASMIVFQGPLFLLKFYDAKNWCQRAGCAAAVFASILAGVVWLTNLRRLKEPWKDDIYDDVIGCARFYRAELKRFMRTQLILTLALYCYILGMTVYARGGGPFYLACVVLFAVVNVIFVAMIVYSRRTNLRRIERLDVLLDAAPSQ